MTGGASKIGPFPEAELASLAPAQNPAEFQFERPDWTLFRNVDTLSQCAGVRKDLLRRIVLKELTDNALDSGATEVSIAETGPDTYTVTDNGSGIVMEPDELARLFSINRPLLSSKLRRLPSRGAMGNGLRVVAGSIAASDGRLKVTTRGRRYTMRPADDGSTRIVATEPFERFVGTEIEITFGEAVPEDKDATRWADDAIDMAQGGEGYTGRPSPYWYDADAFFELLRAAGDRTVREFVEQLDGCTGAKAGKITTAFRGLPCRALSREQALELLTVARYEAKPVRPDRLGQVGRLDRMPAAYSLQRGTAAIGGREPKAEIPFVIEAWAEVSPRDGKADRVTLEMFVNRTPAVAPISAWRAGGDLCVQGCGLAYRFPIPPGVYRITINIITPWCPVTTLGKEPDLSRFVNELAKAIQTATRKAKSAMPKQPSAVSEGLTHKDIILRYLTEGVEKASGGGLYRFNQRQLFYVLRPFVITLTGKEPTWENFCGIITDYEASHPDIPGMYRDARGTLYHPHLGQDISLGTLAVEKYERPAWTFGQILYIEKEGFFEALKAARWPERHDCALVTSKGYTTRAARDLVDALGDGDEPIRVFCVHDADAFGTMIFQTLQEATKARPRRRIEVINLGLEPWEALKMGLAHETVDTKDRAKPVADYVTKAPNGLHWLKWLQLNRVELNAMPTPQFIGWLDEKMAEHGIRKVLPPAIVIEEEARHRLTKSVERIVTERVLREAKVPDQVERIMADIEIPPAEILTEEVKGWIDDHETDAWFDGVSTIVEDIANREAR